MVGAFIPFWFLCWIFPPPQFDCSHRLPHPATPRAEASSKKGMGWQKERDRKLLKHIWSHWRKSHSAGAQVPLGVTKEGGGGRGRSHASPHTAPTPKQLVGFRQQCTHSPWGGKGCSRPPSSCSLNHGFRLPWGMVPARAKTTPHPHSLLPIFTPACLHCLLPTCVQACRDGNSPRHNSQQHQPLPLWGRAVLPSHKLQSPVSTRWRTQWPHSDTAKGIFALCQTGRCRTCKETRHIQPALVAPHLLWFRDEKRTYYHVHSANHIIWTLLGQVYEGKTRTTVRERHRPPQDHTVQHQLAPTPKAARLCALSRVTGWERKSWITGSNERTS